MRVTCLKLKTGVSFVQFGRTFGGNLRFTAAPTPGAPGSVVQNVKATARPDLSGVLMETTIINKFSGKPFNSYVIPFESIDGFEIEAEPVEEPGSLMAAETPEPPAVPAPPEPSPEKRKPGRPPKVAAALALLFVLLGAPAYASDASTDKLSATASVLAKVRCIDGPGAECMTCVHPGTEQFQIVCGLKPKDTAKPAKKVAKK